MKVASAKPTKGRISTGIGFLKDYCVNSSMAGVSYIVNSNLHYSERIFWLMCVSMSAFGSYYLIIEFERNFENKAVSITFEFLKPTDKIRFPTTCICPSYMADDSDEDPVIKAYVMKLQALHQWKEYNKNVEDYFVQLLYPGSYTHENFNGSYHSSMDYFKCCQSNYTDVIKLFSKCEPFFIRCTWYGMPFDCCKYFRPLQTSMGMCFLMNSIHNNKPGSENWFPDEIDTSLGNSVLHVETSAGLYLNFLDQEGLPHILLTEMKGMVQGMGIHKEIYIYKEDMVNDDDVREFSPEARKCRFPDEVLPDSTYNYYSFSGCITDCMRRKHVQLCNCTLLLLVTEDDYETPVCDIEGNMCIEKNDLILANQTYLQPTHKNFDCNCLPSCTEADMRIVNIGIADILPNSSRMLTVNMVDMPATNYRRQAVRTGLDVVVTIGGILGLFMGVSILSVIEFLYFFSVRPYSNKVIWRRERSVSVPLSLDMHMHMKEK